MSGHSKWSTIKHKKGAADAKRGKIFTRIPKEMTVAARLGGGVAIIVEAMTDNGNRTTPEIRHIFEKCGGNFGTPGSVRFQFERKGVFSIEKSAVSEEKLMEVALEAGADDLQTDDPETFEIY